ncbi:hypothetical protein N5T16_26380 [Escherichia coli]|uniref:hypothetical protein n=1 Tax=Escherichia coli TaxID=562 RepID=UPI0022269116|nr:hypothetical protein [Escherichia coli]MCW3282295.1 hypothetical protein [Escherichia coli]
MVKYDLVRCSYGHGNGSGVCRGEVICLITFFVVSWILGRQGKQQIKNEVTGKIV